MAGITAPNNLSSLMPGPNASPAEAVARMNQTLQMMSGQPEIVCQLFGAFTSGGVMPDMQTYELVVRACLQQSLFECVEMMLTAAETQGLPYQSLLWSCLEKAENAFVVKWAPKALEANMTIPVRCFLILFRDRASVGGLKLAVALFKLLLRVGSPEDKTSEALVQSIAEIQQLQMLPEIMRQMQCPNQRVNVLISKLAEKMSASVAPPAPAPVPAVAPMLAPTMLAPTTPAPATTAEEQTYIDLADSEPFSPPPGLPAPVEVSPPSVVKEEDAGAFMEALQQSQDRQDCAAALKVLEDMRAAGVSIAYSLYYGVFKVCMAAGNANDAQTVLEEMRQSYNLDVASYTLLVRAHGAKGRFDKAERVVEDMRLHDVTPDEATHNALLDIAARTGRYEKGWHLLAQMMKLDMSADKYSVSLLLKNVSDKMDKQKLKRGIELVEKYIDSQREEADDILFNSLLDCCCRIKDIPRLERTLQKMKAFNVKPSPATFGTLLKAYGSKNDATSVVRVWNDMKTADVGMNTVTYGCMLDACVKCGNYEKAEEVFMEMKEAGMHRNTILYTTMIKSYSKQKKLRKAVKIGEEMQAEGVPMNCVTFNSLIDAAIRCRDLPTATKMLEQMKESNVAPDLITYSTLIKGFCDQGDLHVACSLLQRLKSQNMKCDEILYNSLLEGCVKAGDLRCGVELFQEMVADRVQMSNITFSIMVKLYAQAGRVDQAMALVQRMEPEFGVKPTNVVFACLVKCCVSSNRAAQAAQLLLGLPKVTKVQPDQQMYASVLPNLIAQNHLDTALEIFEQLCKAPASQDSRTFNFFGLAQQLFEAAGHGHAAVKEKARAVLTAIRPARVLYGEQEKSLTALLGSTWGRQEFVPGQSFNLPEVQAVKEFTPGIMWGAEWEAYQDPTEQQWWGEEWNGAGSQVTPLRPRKEKSENSPPDVMQILLKADVGSGEKMPAKKGKTSPEPVAKPTGPLEFKVPAQPMAVLQEKNLNN
jgi:pentatricopeptide repeat protein